ncbi:aminoglycoside phosphotransferase family protein [Streptomyces sp. N2-109]|uniref:Aminoglycoside phosphotransferase family protein n=1 Tax=Streptomyces gossypii TaxID=2883101 RepID=A0ABT2JZV9_9ACTN|nr:aminoglycoside phosphotransferase family protein [Streptomyces gossypii]MCT2593452.1 aminoglycoside phosphotransferase family protein [Streptomyces gossypii]
MLPMPGELVPASLPVVTTMGAHDSGRTWLAELPRLIRESAERWDLRLGEPYHGGSCSWVAPVLRRNSAGQPAGAPAVLKLTWPHPEADAEAAALRRWAGRGAVRVYEDDPQRYALLLERCDPGTELGAAHGIPADERLTAAAGVLRELWDGAVAVDVPGAAPPEPEPSGPQPAPQPGAELTGLARLGLTRPQPDRMTGITAAWADLAEERAARSWPDGIDTGLFALGARLLRELPKTATRDVLLHGDLNPGNLLAARRRPWLAIDAKPMTGDPAFDPWPLIEQVDDPFAKPDPHTVLTRRTALVSEILGEDPWRVRAWAVARHVEYLLWSVVEDEDLTRSVGLMAQTRILADVAGL